MDDFLRYSSNLGFFFLLRTRVLSTREEVKHVLSTRYSFHRQMASFAKVSIQVKFGLFFEHSNMDRSKRMVGKTRCTVERKSLKSGRYFELMSVESREWRRHATAVLEFTRHGFTAVRGSAVWTGFERFLSGRFKYHEWAYLVIFVFLTWPCPCLDVECGLWALPGNRSCTR